jgi:hypothetical protein
MSSNAKKYIEENYQWDKIMKKYDKAITYITDINE